MNNEGERMGEDGRGWERMGEDGRGWERMGEVSDMLTLQVIDFKLSPCSERCILSFGWFPDIRILYADVSEHSICYIFISGVSRKNNWISYWLRLFSSQIFSRTNTATISPRLFFVLTPPMKVGQIECSETSAYKSQTLGNHPKERK